MMKEVRLLLVHYLYALRHDIVVQSLLFLAGACILMRFANKPYVRFTVKAKVKVFVHD